MPNGHDFAGWVWRVGQPAGPSLPSGFAVGAGHCLVSAGPRPFISLARVSCGSGPRLEAEEEVGEANDRAAATVAAPSNCLRQRVIGAVRERVAVDDEEGTSHLDGRS